MRAPRLAHRVLRNMVMEGEWDSADPVGEARWIEGLAGRCGAPHALAAQIWLDRDDVAEVLAAYAEHAAGAQRAPQAALHLARRVP